MKSALLALGLLIGGRPPVEPPPLPPGGYYGVGELPEIPPPDGERAILTGSILFPIGVLRAGAGAIQVYTATPPRCSFTPSSCQGLTIFGFVGVSTGILMMGTGLTFLSIGLVRRQRYRSWMAARNLSAGLRPDLAPRWTLEMPSIPGGSGVSLRVRF